MNESDDRGQQGANEAVCACCGNDAGPLTRLSNGMAYCHTCAQTLGRAIGPASNGARDERAASR